MARFLRRYALRGSGEGYDSGVGGGGDGAWPARLPLGLASKLLRHRTVYKKEPGSLDHIVDFWCLEPTVYFSFQKYRRIIH